MYKKRVLVSIDGRCPMECKHCYTYDLNKKNLERSVEELVNSIVEKEFDIINVSQSNENFFEQNRGLDLCNSLYEKYHKDMYIITRSCLNDEIIEEIGKLGNRMNDNGNRLYFSVSLCADSSYSLTENIDVCPSPVQRLSNLERLHKYNISTLLLLRPLFPDNIIAIEEYMGLIKKSRKYIDVVISSGLILTENILERLNMNENDFAFLEKGDSEYLDNINPEKVKYVDVEKELLMLEKYCEIQKIPFFRHSMPALNYLKSCKY